MDLGNVFARMLAPILGFFSFFLKLIFFGSFGLLLVVLVYFFVRYQFNPLKLEPDKLRKPYIKNKWLDLFRWLVVDFPEDLLSEISQQRKQRVKIVATAQFFTRVAKPLREQAATVVSCSTLWGRLTTNKEYDALQYALVLDNPAAVNKKLKPLRKQRFVQSDGIRACYDTFEKIERMQKVKFIMDFVSVQLLVKAFCMLMSMFVAFISMTTFFISYVYSNLQAGILRFTFRTKWDEDFCYLFSHIACLAFFGLYFTIMLFLFARVI